MSAARLTQAVLWTVAAILLGASVWPFLVAVPVGERAADAPRSKSPPVPSIAELSLPPIETFSETLNRPVFVATRRPPSPLAALHGQSGTPQPAPAAKGPKGEKLVLGRYFLRGIVVTPEQKLVLLTQQGTNKALRLKEGDALDDWRVATIAPDHVILRQGDRQERVTLRDKP